MSQKRKTLQRNETFIVPPNYKNPNIKNSGSFKNPVMEDLEELITPRERETMIAI